MTIQRQVMTYIVFNFFSANLLIHYASDKLSYHNYIMIFMIKYSLYSKCKYVCLLFNYHNKLLTLLSQILTGLYFILLWFIFLNSVASLPDIKPFKHASLFCNCHMIVTSSYCLYVIVLPLQSSLKLFYQSKKPSLYCSVFTQRALS